MNKSIYLSLGAGAILTGLTTVNAAVSVGDLAVIGVHSDILDSFSWVALNDINAGETLYFSDSSYESSTDSFRGENLLRLQVASTILAGTISTINPSTAGGTLPAGYSMVANTAYSTSGSTNLSFFSSNGDQLVIFQDDDTSGSSGFIGLAAVNFASNQWGGIPANSATESDLYSGLTNGVSAVAVGAGSGASDEFDNTRYTGITSGSAAVLFQAINNAANWEGTNTLQANGWTANSASGFSVVPEPSTSLILGVGSLLLLGRRKRA